MILLRARIHVDPRNRAQVLRSLTRILERTRTLSGCLSCHLYADVEDDDTLCFIEQWTDEQTLANRLQAESTRVLLSALDLACEPPDVRFETIGEARGIEFIDACRQGGRQK